MAASDYLRGIVNDLESREHQLCEDLAHNQDRVVEARSRVTALLEDQDALSGQLGATRTELEAAREALAVLLEHTHGDEAKADWDPNLAGAPTRQFERGKGHKREMKEKPGRTWLMTPEEVTFPRALTGPDYVRAKMCYEVLESGKTSQQDIVLFVEDMLKAKYGTAASYVSLSMKILLHHDLVEWTKEMAKTDPATDRKASPVWRVRPGSRKRAHELLDQKIAEMTPAKERATA